MSVSVQIDLRSKFGWARDQGQRPTCIAFAASDAHAAHRVMPFAPLSVEYAFYHASLKRLVFDPNAGVGMSDILSSIEGDGQPLENGWPYLRHLPSDISSYHPPADVGVVFKRESESHSSFARVVDVLKEGRAPLIAMHISTEFYLAKAQEVLRAPVSSKPVARHALVVAGLGEEQNEQVVLIRNSWGVNWADSGYAWISRSYLEPRLISVGVMKP
jgi:hypothetical protein